MRRQAHAEAGLTLVELLIAIALMLILTLQLQIIFGHSRKLYLGADAMAQVYSNARAALDMIEKDVANAAKTDQMDFFNDKRTQVASVGHFNPGEENLTLRGKFIPGKYIHAMAFRQPEEYEPKDKAKFGQSTKFRRDSMHFRTFTTVNGEPREALVQYRLWLGNDPKRDPIARPILQRIVTAAKLGADGQPVVDPTTGDPTYEQQDPQDVCYYVQEFKIEPWLRDRRARGVGKFYSPKDVAAAPGQMQKPPTAEDRFPPTLPNLMAGTPEESAIECLDGGDESDPGAQVYASDGKLHLKNGDRLPRLVPGDFMYIAVTKPPPGFSAIHFFDNRYLTIKDIQITGGETVVSFEEEDLVKQMISTATVPIECAYRGGWLPKAIRVELKIKDQRSEEIRTITRIFQLLKA